MMEKAAKGQDSQWKRNEKPKQKDRNQRKISNTNEEFPLFIQLAFVNFLVKQL